jgi:hypothetical protein
MVYSESLPLAPPSALLSQSSDAAEGDVIVRLGEASSVAEDADRAEGRSRAPTPLLTGAAGAREALWAAAGLVVAATLFDVAATGAGGCAGKELINALRMSASAACAAAVTNGSRGG